MGLLSEGTALSWAETKKYADHVRRHGIKQFLVQYHKLESRTKDVLYWGDEVEYQLLKFDHVNKKVYLALRGQEVLKNLQEKTKVKNDSAKDVPTSWHPEYAQYMVEGTPGRPYGGSIAHFNIVEANMRLRRQEIQAELNDDEVPLSLTAFPLLGVREFTWPTAKTDPVDGVSRSLFFPDDAINQGHPRFKTLTRNIRTRRKEKVAINIPIFQDVHTKRPFKEDLAALGDDGEAARAAQPDHIYMDCMGFGMGNCCLQVTFQACNIEEARYLYDQLAGMCPIMLALSASSPIYRGYLSDIDTRWPVIAQSVDDRTREERGLEPLKEDRFRINKSRYDSIDSYISPLGRCYNDIDLTLDQELCDELMAGGVDDLLARHVAHLFIRDPVSLFSEKINQDDENDTDHFENIQSTNWQTMRFKPPPPGSNIGWRVEFRPMEAQLTDFENAAFTVFIVLLTRVILSYKLNLIIPISKVDENLKTAFKRNAVKNDQFYFRKDVLTASTPPECAEQCKGCGGDDYAKGEYTLMTVNEIFHGKDDFPGLLALINLYMDSIEIDVDTRCTILQYLKLISMRASGELETSASWMRNFVTSHPDYKQDSVVSGGIAYDLLSRVAQISQGAVQDPKLLFKHTTKSSDSIPAAVSSAEAFLKQKTPSGSKSAAAAQNENGGSKTHTPPSTSSTSTSNSDSVPNGQ
ncbi:glutamate--cysteine ligase catalytic subunit [Aplysia californica]|uniref:Glutamate--cysteine ligase n=1 Tax=Aplysia californica TaxID=6500 RepID=A0ABM1A6V6_APLCA|nr:glutamate--cysteine ligase catalytic subunit [Aplysia californica]